MNLESSPGIVLDCMIYLQAVTNANGPAAAILRQCEAGRFTLFVSNTILDEIRDVLTRPRIRQKNPDLTDSNLEAFLQRLSQTATLVHEVTVRFTYERDPKDECYINLALASEAVYLISRDKDLLDLMNDNLPDGKAFRERFPGLTILDPIAFLQIFNTP